MTFSAQAESFEKELKPFQTLAVTGNYQLDIAFAKKNLLEVKAKSKKTIKPVIQMENQTLNLVGVSLVRGEFSEMKLYAQPFSKLQCHGFGRIHLENVTQKKLIIQAAGDCHVTYTGTVQVQKSIRDNGQISLIQNQK